jgi:hypothetical protein
MLEVLKELYELHLPTFQRLASRQSRLNIRHLNKLHRAELGRALSAGEFADLATDLSQDALADHWERYCKYCESNIWPMDCRHETEALEIANRWLESSRLRFPRRSVSGFGKTRPQLPHSDLADSLLSDRQRLAIAMRSQGATWEQMVIELYGYKNSRTAAKFKRFMLNLEQSLSFIAQLSASLDEFSEASDTLAMLRDEVTADFEPLDGTTHKPASRVPADRAFDLALFYSRQGSANPKPVVAPVASPEPIDWAPVRSEVHPVHYVPTWKPGRFAPSRGLAYVRSAKPANQFYAECKRSANG